MRLGRLCGFAWTDACELAIVWGSASVRGVGAGRGVGLDWGGGVGRSGSSVETEGGG